MTCGDVLATMGLEEGWIAVDIDRAAVAAARAEIPYLRSLETDRARIALTLEGTTR